jgi:hypothetical protein
MTKENLHKAFLKQFKIQNPRGLSQDTIIGNLSNGVKTQSFIINQVDNVAFI